MSNYVVLDLEMCNTYKTARNKQMNYKQELIQIGAVSLDDNYNVIDSFVTYVSPEFGVVDGWISQLTGISKNDVKHAPSAREALAAFVAWLPEGAQIVAWSDNDERQIRSEMRRKEFDIPLLSQTFGTWIDCQQMFGDKFKTSKKYKLSEALAIANVCYDDGAHDALVDSRNTARLFEKLKSNEEFEVSPYFVSANNIMENVFNPFAPSAKVSCAC